MIVTSFGNIPRVLEQRRFHARYDWSVFEILEHPADIGFRAFGATLEELFANVAIAMLSIAGDPQAAEPRQEYRIEVESGDRDGLMVYWLNEVLYWYDGRLIALREFRVDME